MAQMKEENFETSADLVYGSAR